MSSSFSTLSGASFEDRPLDIDVQPSHTRFPTPARDDLLVSHPDADVRDSVVGGDVTPVGETAPRYGQISDPAFLSFPRKTPIATWRSTTMR
jgi:hypothetical protein